MGWRNATIVAVALTLVGAACSTDKPAGSPDGDGKKSATYTVQVDSHKPASEFGTYFSKFFPGEVKVRAGDSIDFKLNWSGEPHSVTFGTLVDAGAEKLDPTSREEPAEWQKIPLMLPEGPGDAVQAGINPCYVETGDPPKEDLCENRTQPKTFTGTYSMHSSGFLPEGSTYRVTFDSAIDAGTYSYFCTLHRGVMVGKVTVVAATETVPSPDEVATQADTEIDAIRTKLAGAYDKSKQGMGPGSILAGTGDPTLIEGGTDAGVTEFLPAKAIAKVGETVKFLPVGPHTVSFNTPQDAVESLVKAGDGTWHINPKAFGPTGSPPSGPPGEKPVVTDAGTWNGEGFLNSGILLGFGPPGALTWQVKFGKAGTYEFRCLLHPDMEGSITVA
ncbi:MAG TPA: plastocyanin/azurin family copper-binding protein [Actinomycetota bacterium]|nr:plastocyanin/azurin family copper-binding protein [Actinomycetota bacterium]